MTKIAEIFEIPDRVHQGDFVLRLTEGVNRPQETLKNYVVTPELVVCFDQALSLIRGAVDSNSSKGAYLHGSFGSGKSHFMAVLTLLLRSNTEARSIPELADVVARNNTWTQNRKFLVVPYHMIGATSMESALLGHYAEYIRKIHLSAPTPGFYRADALQNAEWMIFEKIGAFTEPYKTRAEGIVSLVTNALTHDEHVSSLALTIRQAQSEAVTLLADAATKPSTPEPEPPQPEPSVPGRKLAKQGRKMVKASEAKQVFGEIESDLSEQTGATLEVDWKVWK